MNYYKRHIGDYAKKAGRLSMVQHGSYTLLLDACYDREQFPTLAEAIDWTWASSAAEVEAVEFVLRKFFVLEGERYVQKRIEEEIEEYRIKAETNSRIAQERETKRKEEATKRARIVHEAPEIEHEAPPNHKPLTTINTPIPPSRGQRSAVSLKTWADERKAAGEVLIPDDDPVFAYAADAGIPDEFMALAWGEFKARYAVPDAKRYKDWRSVFRKAVRGNWLKLWFLDGEGFKLTTTGMQAQRVKQVAGT